MPSMDQFRGLSLDRAECYGKPHVGAYYASSNVNSNRLHHGAMCAVCGKPATNSHHHPPKGTASTFKLEYPDGSYQVLRPSLLAVCGSGTTGCHGLIHQRKVRIRWEWDDLAYQEQYWQGLIGSKPHDPILYRFGHWVIEIDTPFGTEVRTVGGAV